MISTGIVRMSAIQNFCDNDRVSLWSPSSSATVFGSKVIPHFGHAPGRSCSISGCMGQVQIIGRFLKLVDYHQVSLRELNRGRAMQPLTGVLMLFGFVFRR